MLTVNLDASFLIFDVLKYAGYFPSAGPWVSVGMCAEAWFVVGEGILKGRGGVSINLTSYIPSSS